MQGETLSSTFLKAINDEKEADYTQTLELLSTLSLKQLLARNLAILNLAISNVRSGIGDKRIVELVQHKIVGDEIIENADCMKIGDIVRIESKKDLNDEVTVDGVVTKITSKQINVALNDETHTESKAEDKLMTFYSSDTMVSLVKISNSITYKRIESTLRKLGELESYSELIQLLLGSSYTPPSNQLLSNSMAKLEFEAQLNQSQKNAINFSLNSIISIIHGPFGTGKTSTIVELIKQLLKTGTSKRILVCGPSNISVDNVLERLDLPNEKLLRIGHPARLLPLTLKHSIDIISKESDQGLILKDIMDEIDSNIRSLKKTKSKKQKYEIYQKNKDLRKDLSLRSKKSVKELINNSQVVCCTLHGSGSRELRDIEFDTLIIDEVSQSLEPQCWIPIINHQSIKRLIIAGDNKQLSPTIKLNANSKSFKLLSKTLFDRLTEIYSDKFLSFLNIQYRMNDKICKFPSMMLYDDKVKSGYNCKDILLSQLPGVESNDDTIEPLIWYDTQGGDFNENESEQLDNSKFNENESLIVLKHIRALTDSGVKESQIGVISPYNAQVSLLRKKLVESPEIEVSTIDGFQGREKGVIILSLVRSNSNREIGFLKSIERLNVSITRCQRQLCVIGDMELFASCNDDFWKKFVEFGEENFEIRYPDLNELYNL